MTSNETVYNDMKDLHWFFVFLWLVQHQQLPLFIQMCSQKDPE